MDRFYLCVAWIKVTKISHLFANVRPSPKIGIVAVRGE